MEAEIICGCIGERRSCTRGEPVSPFSAPLLAPPSGGQHPVVLNSDIFPSFHVTDIVGLEPFRYCTKLANSANHTPVRGHYPNCETFLRATVLFIVSKTTNAMLWISIHTLEIWIARTVALIFEVQTEFHQIFFGWVNNILNKLLWDVA